MFNLASTSCKEVSVANTVYECVNVIIILLYTVEPLLFRKCLSFKTA